MTFGKASALALAVVGALALGIWVSPHVRNLEPAPATSVVQGSGLPKDGQPARSATNAAPKSTPKAAESTAPAEKAPDAMRASAENVQAHVKPLLNRGANMDKASEGFRSAEQFVTVAHAARNTEIPFILLKHRVLTEGKSLTTAIRESKPAVDASAEASRARAEAKADLAKLRTNTSN